MRTARQASADRPGSGQTRRCSLSMSSTGLPAQCRVRSGNHHRVSDLLRRSRLARRRQDPNVTCAVPRAQLARPLSLCLAEDHIRFRTAVKQSSGDHEHRDERIRVRRRGRPAANDVLLPKKHPSAFFGTPLASYLINLRADTVVVTGCTTSGCVRGSVVDAFAYNFRVAVPSDAFYDRSAASHAVNLFDMSEKYADVMTTEECAKSGARSTADRVEFLWAVRDFDRASCRRCRVHFATRD